MTQSERAFVGALMNRIEPALTPGTPAHAAFVLLRDLLGETHGAASHAPRTRRARSAPEPSPPTPPIAGGASAMVYCPVPSCRKLVPDVDKHMTRDHGGAAT